MLIVALLQIAGPLIVRRAIDTQIGKGRTDGLGTLVLLYLGVLLAVFVFSFLEIMIMTYVGQRVMMDLRLQLFGHVQRMSIAFFDRNPVGRLLTRLTNDVATLEQVLSQGVIQTLTSVFVIIAIGCVLLVLDWRLALIMLTLVPLLSFAVRWIALEQRDGFREQRAWLSRINAYLNENITGMAVVQLFNRQKRNFQRFDQRNDSLLQANLKVVFYYAIFEPVVVLFNAVTAAIIIWYGGGRALHHTLTVGTLVAFLQYMQSFFYPIRSLSEQLQGIQQAMASSERIFGILDSPEEVTDSADARDLADVKGAIEFRDVWFAYDDDNWVLKDVSFAIAPGEKVAIVGATGAGKSTMMSLLNRFYDVQRGAILVDGVPIRELRQRELRRQVGLVLQDAFIFTDTVEQNIRMRDPQLSTEAVHAAARVVGADAFVLALPDGYETVLAERGANLSTGQKQLDARWPAWPPSTPRSSWCWTKPPPASTRRRKRRCSVPSSASWRAAPPSSSHTASTRSATWTASWCCSRAASWRRARTRRCWRNAASTTACTSCSTRTRTSAWHDAESSVVSYQSSVSARAVGCRLRVAPKPHPYVRTTSVVYVGASNPLIPSLPRRRGSSVRSDVRRFVPVKPQAGDIVCPADPRPQDYTQRGAGGAASLPGVWGPPTSLIHRGPRRGAPAPSSGGASRGERFLQRVHEGPSALALLRFRGLDLGPQRHVLIA